MSINSKCYIPNDADPKDIIVAIAYLCGAERIKTSLGRFGRNADSYYADYNHNEVSVSPEGNNKGKKVFVSPTHSMTFFEIWIAKTTCERMPHIGSLFINDSDELGYHCIYAGVNKFWHDIDRELIKLFGGKVDDNDSDSVDWNYRKPKPRKNNHPTHGRLWQDFQQALLDLPVLFHFLED